MVEWVYEKRGVSETFSEAEKKGCFCTAGKGGGAEVCEMYLVWSVWVGGFFVGDVVYKKTESGGMCFS